MARHGWAAVLQRGGFLRMGLTMRRAVLVGLLVVAGLGRAWAGDVVFTPEQRAAIVAVVREALKADPSILREAVISLQADDQAREQADQKARLAASQPVLTANAGDPVAGNPAGDVTLVEFYDPRCPYCRKMLPAVESLLRNDPKLRLVYKDIPVLGAASTMEARAILAAQAQGGYLKMQAALMRDAAAPSEAMIAATARGLGLDAARLAADMNGAAVSQRIAANLDLARALRIEGTPVWVVGNVVIPGAVDQAALEAAVTAARRRG